MSVPDTSTFSLINVKTELGLGATTDLSTCFKNSIDASFDINYKGSKNSLYNFRNYNYLNTDWKESSDIWIVAMPTYPFYSGTYSYLGKKKENWFGVIYVTGKNYPYHDYNGGNTGPIGKWLKNPSDFSDWVAYGFSEHNTSDYHQTPRPLFWRDCGDGDVIVPMPLQLLKVCEDMPSYDPGENKRLDPSITFGYYGTPSWGSYRLSFYYVEGSTANTPPLPTLSLNKSIIYFDADKDPITNGNFDITANLNGRWYIMTNNFDISLNKWWGNGNTTVTASVLSTGFTADISVWHMGNHPNNPPSSNAILTITVFATKSITLSSTALYFNWDGTPKSIDYIDVSSNVNWITNVEFGWCGIDPDSATIGTTRVTIDCSVNEDYVNRESYIIFRKSTSATIATATIYQDMNPG